MALPTCKQLFTLLLMGFMFSAHAQSGGTGPRGGGKNLTEEFTRIQQQLDDPDLARALAQEFTSLKKYKVLVVSGFFSNIMKIVPGGKYLADHENFLKTGLSWKEGEDFEFVSLNSQGTVNQNFPEVTKYILASDRPVIIVAHSKGGLDSLKAMVKDPTALAKVAGFIPMQTPFDGTPMVGPFLQVPIISHVVHLGLSILGGGSETLHDLGQARNRHRWQDKYRDQVEQVLEKVKVISVSTWLPHTIIPNTPIPLRGLFFGKDCENDGMVSKESAILPGSDFIVIPEVDHAGLIMNSLQNFDREKTFKSILLLFLRSLRENASRSQLL